MTSGFTTDDGVWIDIPDEAVEPNRVSLRGTARLSQRYSKAENSPLSY